jgi:hypothetical protein
MLAVKKTTFDAGAAVLVGIAVLVVAAIVVVEFAIPHGYIVVFLIGMFVGAVELLGRYLYSPLRALATLGGLSYVAVNIVSAVAAYYMIGPHGFDVFSQAGTAEPSDLTTLKAILLAGFGALGFMRSSIFSVRVGDSSIGIGPAAILDTLLLVADRGVDRTEAIYRSREVTNMLSGVDPVKGSALLAAYCLGLMQNVAADEQKKIQDAVKRIASDADYPKEIRLDLIALELSKVVGPTVLEAAVLALGDRLSRASAALGAAAGQGAGAVAAGGGGAAGAGGGATAATDASKPAAAGSVGDSTVDGGTGENVSPRDFEPEPAHEAAIPTAGDVQESSGREAGPDRRLPASEAKLSLDEIRAALMRKPGP